ncbi:MAG: molybdopterin molybdotransferase MoeA, partial [Pseudomonadota bacterium]
MSKRPPLLSVDDALEQILVDVQPLAAEPVALTHALGRVLAAPLAAKRTQPPFPASAMDGYAVRHADLFEGAALTCVGEAAAGHAFSGAINAGECVRIFTGAPVPSGADTILIQENARANGTKITVLEAAERGRYVRPAGLDFAEGDEGLKAGTVLSPADISLAAAMDHPRLPVRRKPRIAVISTGDELVEPGQERRDDQIVSSNNYGIQAMIEDFGGEPMDIGIVKDTLSALENAFDAAADADIIITLGGASVGDHDLVHHALGQRGVPTAFWKLAMRPGKPMMFGTKRRSDGGHQ